MPCARGFKTLVVLFGATWIPVFVPLVHLVAHLRDLGHSTAVGAWVTGLIGMGAIGGRILMGAFSDRFGRVLTLAIGLALEAAAFLGLALAQHLVPVAMAAGLFGFAYATISVIYPALIADYFGRAHAGGIVGALFAIAGCLSGLGPIAAGALYDATGTYRMAFAASAALNAGALLLTAFCTNPGPPPEASTSAARVRGYRGLGGSPDP
jgi:MFS family permease